MRQKQPPHDAGQRGGQRGDDDERVEPALEIDHQQEINQHNRAHQTNGQTQKAGAHRFGLAAHDNAATARQVFFDFFDERLEVAQHAAEIAPVHVSININDGNDVVMRDNRRDVHARNARQIRQNLRVTRARLIGADRHRVELLHGIHGVFRRAHVDEILNADFRINPVSRLHLGAAAQAEQNRIGHVLFRQAEFRRFGTVNGNAELRPVVRLLHAHVHRAGNFFDLLRELHGDGMAGGLIASDDLHVERRGQTEIQRLAYDVRRQKIKSRAGKLTVQPLAQLADVIFRRRVAGFELHEYVRVSRPDDAAGIVTQIDRGIRNADVVENAGDFPRRNFRANGMVDLTGQPLGFLDARAGVRADVQQKLSGIHRREKIPAEHRRQQPGRDAKQEKEHCKRPAMFKTAFQQGAIATPKTVEAVFKGALKFDQRQEPDGNLGFVNVFAVQFHIAVKPHHQRGHERPRKDVAGEHGKHHGFRQRHEQITRHAGQKKHGHEHDANAQRRDKRRQCDFLRADENRIFQLFAGRHVAMDVFNRHRRVVHQNADRQRQTAERH